jgi:galactose mutarotase-like enzyme
LISLVPSWGSEMLWQADPAIWGWHAPNLFPIVGALDQDRLIVDGVAYPMKKHGFLRHSVCDLVAASPTECAFRLTDSAETRAQYPFAFDLTIRYRLRGDRITGEFALHNPGDRPLPASLGAHPAFQWPLGGAERAAHRVLFAEPEPSPIRRVTVDGLIAADTLPSPVEIRTLALQDHLFDDDALIFDHLTSRALVYGAPGGPGIALTFGDFPWFGIWSKPNGARFVCLEPWQGHASPVGYDGEFIRKPGLAILAPDETRSWHYTIRPVERIGAPLHDR